MELHLSRNLFVALFALASLAQARTVYVVTELLVGDTADSSLISDGRALNNQGVTAIEYRVNTWPWSHGARCVGRVCSNIQPLDINGHLVPIGINDTGHITGGAQVGENYHAFVNDGTSTVDLGGLPDDNCGGCTDTFGHDINASGQVTGRGDPASGGSRAFIYTNGTMTVLDTLGGDFAAGWSINDSGVITGSSTLSNGRYRAFLYDGSLVDLGTLGGKHSYGSAINNHNVVVGCSSIAGDVATRPFVYENGSMTALGSFGGTNGCASGINNHGHVVGYSNDVNGNRRAFVFRGGTMIDLNTVMETKSGKKWKLLQARAINDRGEIVGVGTREGVTRAFLLSPLSVSKP